MLEQFIGEEVIIKFFDTHNNIKEKEPESKIKGILINLDLKEDYATIFTNEGRIITYMLEEKTQLHFENHKNIRNRILNIPKPKKVTRAQLIDLED